jgi:hypothetical protein
MFMSLSWGNDLHLICANAVEFKREMGEKNRFVWRFAAENRLEALNSRRKNDNEGRRTKQYSVVLHRAPSKKQKQKIWGEMASERE